MLFCGLSKSEFKVFSVVKDVSIYSHNFQQNSLKIRRTFTSFLDIKASERHQWGASQYERSLHWNQVTKPLEPPHETSNSSGSSGHNNQPVLYSSAYHHACLRNVRQTSQSHPSIFCAHPLRHSGVCWSLSQLIWGEGRVTPWMKPYQHRYNPGWSYIDVDMTSIWRSPPPHIALRVINDSGTYRRPSRGILSILSLQSNVKLLIFILRILFVPC